MRPARFVVQEGGSVRHFELAGDAVRVGSGAKCELRVSGEGISTEHLVVERGASGWRLRDTMSKQGTRVNGALVETRRLRDGDRIEVGDAVLVFENPERAVRRAAAPPRPVVPPPAAEEIDRLRTTLRALASESDFRKLLTSIADQVISLTGAERGFFVLRTSEGKYDMVAARTLDREAVQRPSLKISRSVAEEVARTGKPLLTTNAQADARLAGSSSVEGMKLRSVLCVPLVGRAGFMGFLYLDHRFEEAAFRPETLAVVEAFADQAAVALENARLVAELRQRTEELARSKARVEELNRMLEERVQRQRRELDEVRTLLRDRADAPLKYDYRNIVGRSAAMREVLRIVDHVIDTTVPVLVLGESGTGKELIARAIHGSGPRKSGPFVAENCAAIPETLLESELFGHVRGAFTGADRDRVGLFELAHRGTLFLDEMGEIPPSTQVKLLRALETGELRRVGGKDTIKVDVRIVSATNRDIRALVAEGRFREDLYYRINVLEVRLPPLRERREDIPELVQHFLEEHARESGAEAKTITPDAMALLVGYAWPGNVRQLRNEILRAVALSGQVILPEVLSADVRRRSVPVPSQTAGARSLREIVQEAVDVVERRAVEEALARSGGRKGEAAELLGVSRPTLDAKIKRHHVRWTEGAEE